MNAENANTETGAKEAGVCLYETEDDDDAFREYAAECRRKDRERKRNAIHNIAKKRGLTHRLYFANEGTVLFDGVVYYYSHKRLARIKGTREYIEVRGVEDFFNRFSDYAQKQIEAVPAGSQAR